MVTFPASKLIWHVEKVVIAALTIGLIIGAIFLVVIGYDTNVRHRLASHALRWMETKTYPDVCGYQGEFPYHYSGGFPCFTKSGYRFINGVDTWGQWSTPYRRIVKVRPTGEWKIGDVIISWTNDWVLNQMRLQTASTSDLQELINAIPEIGTQPR